MIVALDELSKLLNNKWDISIGEDEMILFVFDYSYKLPPACTQLDRINREAGIVRIDFKTSFGIFHTDSVGYDELLCVLMESCSGALAETLHDLTIAAFTYPDITERRTISCSR